MPPTYTARRRSSSWLTIISIVAALLLSAAATVGVLWGAGIVDLAALWRQPVEAAPQAPPGMLMVPISSRALTAYSKVSRDDMWDSKKGRFTFTILGPEYVYLGLTVRPGRSGQMLLEPGDDSPAAEGGVLSGDELVQHDDKPTSSLLDLRESLMRKDVGQLVRLTLRRKSQPIEVELTLREYVLSFGSASGRVLDRDKSIGVAFREVDFLPEDTREGLAAGIPLGKRGMTFEATKLIGVHGLRIKDRIDLIANVPIEHLSLFDSNQASALGPGGRLPQNQLAISSEAKAPPKTTEARVLTKGAVIVTPVVMRPVPKTDTTVFGSSTKNSQVQQITIAVDEEDAPTVTEAIAAGLTIQCVALSGVPGNEQAEKIPEGMAAVPVSGRVIPANLRLTHSDLIDPRTREQRYIRLPIEGLDRRGVVLDPLELIGRVLTVDKPAGELFLREELAPPGTPEGLAGALPGGRRSFTLDVSRLDGADQLRRGDRLDILASIPLNLPSTLQTIQPISAKQEIRVLVHDGIVLAPPGSHETRSVGTGPGAPASKREIILGVSPDEVSLLVQALRMDAGLTAIFRSRNEEPDAGGKQARVPSLIPNFDPLAGSSLIETRVGRQREHWLSPAKSQSPLGYEAAPLPAAADETPVKGAAIDKQSSAAARSGTDKPVVSGALSLVDTHP